jgi:hypothetical protein
MDGGKADELLDKIGVRWRGDREDDETDLERLGIPVLDLSYRRHVAEIVWQLIKLFDTMCKANGKLL